MTDNATDHIADAPDVSHGGTVSSGQAPWSNVNATENEVGEPRILDGRFTAVVWQKVFVPGPGDCDFHHDPFAEGDTVMGVFRGPANATYAQLVLVGQDDDGAGNSKPSVTIHNAAPNWYYIGSTGYNSTQWSGQKLLWTIPTEPPPLLSADGVTVVSILPYHPGPARPASVEPRGVTAVTCNAALDGVLQLSALAQGATAVRVHPTGALQGSGESDGATAVSVDFAVAYSVSVRADGASRVLLLYRAPMFGDPDVDSDFTADDSIPAPMNAPISIAMDLRGTLGVLPPPLVIA